MRIESMTVRSNDRIAKEVYRMKLVGNTRGIKRPGQFVNIKLDGFFLRRPISVCHWTDEELCIIYKVVGRGTEYMSRLASGKRLDIMMGLGNGFDLSKSGANPLLIGGGVGTPPMYGLCRALLQEGKMPIVILGFNTADEIFLADDFARLGVKTIVTTVDGSAGIKGFVTDAMNLALDSTYFFACGPLPMLKAVYEKSNTGGQLSFEERMGCGFGACMGCSCKTKYGNKRICRDGPVLEKEEVIW